MGIGVVAILKGVANGAAIVAVLGVLGWGMKMLVKGGW